MATLLECPGCGEAAAVTRAHRGATFPCCRCGAPIVVPRTLDYRRLLREGLADRKSGYRAMTVAWLSAVVCFLPVPVVSAGVWWWSARRIHLAREESREVPEPLLAARTIAAVGFVSQVATWAVWLVG